MCYWGRTFLVKFRFHIGFFLFTAVCLSLVYGRIGSFGIINYDDMCVAQYYQRVSERSFDENLRTFMFGSDFDVYYSPLAKLSGYLDFLIYKKYFGYIRYTNVVLHLLTALFVFSLLNYATRSPWRSFFVAALFALHPMNSESIVPLYARVTPLSGLFCMAGLFFYCYYAARPNKIRYLTVIFLFMLSFITKPTMLINVLILPLLDYWPLGRIFPPPPPVQDHTAPKPGIRREWNRLVIVEKIPLVLVGAAWFLFTSWYVSKSHIPELFGTGTAPLSLSARLTALPISYVAYLFKTIFPVGLPSYTAPLFYQGLPILRCLGAILLLLLISGLIVRFSRRYPYLLTGWVWFLVILTPHIPIVVSQRLLVIERYGYISLIGLFIIITWAGADVLQHFRVKRPLTGLFAGLVILSLGMITCYQTGHRKDALSFYQHAVTVFPGSSEAHSRLGELLINNGRADEALYHFNQASQLDPENAVPQSHLGDFYAAAGQPEKAVAHYRRALQIKPDYAAVHNNFANLLVELGKPEQAIVHYRSALALNPQAYEIYNNLATALINVGEFDQAGFYLKKALFIKPDYQTARENLKRLPAIKKNRSAAPESPMTKSRKQYE